MTSATVGQTATAPTTYASDVMTTAAKTHPPRLARHLPPPRIRSRAHRGRIGGRRDIGDIEREWIARP
jgi:hypothetical protein